MALGKTHSVGDLDDLDWEGDFQAQQQENLKRIKDEELMERLAARMGALARAYVRCGVCLAIQA